jgi:prepilin-type processing-associated H-X9-DG protein
MKVVNPPDEVAYAEPDYANYDSAAEQAREKAHQDSLKAWLSANGWPGERTGQILREPHADGYANYMYADGPKPVLVHLPYGDAWDSPNVAHLPKKEVLARLDRQVAMAALFSKAA